MYVPDEHTREGKMLSTYVSLEELAKALKSKRMNGLEEGILDALKIPEISHF